jgi:hypothetical protein
MYTDPGSGALLWQVLVAGVRTNHVRQLLN